MSCNRDKRPGQLFAQSKINNARKGLNMKPVLTIVVLFFVVVSMAHLARILFSYDIVINGMQAPMWVSIFGFIIPLLLAFLLWRENRS